MTSPPFLQARPVAIDGVATTRTFAQQYDDSTTPLGASATFTGAARYLAVADAEVLQEVVASAESNVTGTLWLEVSRDDGVTWRRVKSVATAAVTGGGFYAEIIHRPSWPMARVGFTNGAGAQARFTLNSVLKAA